MALKAWNELPVNVRRSIRNIYEYIRLNEEVGADIGDDNTANSVVGRIKALEDAMDGAEDTLDDLIDDTSTPEENEG